MLIELRIRNVAVFESESINFGSGLTVITGDTGAGKSVVLQALEFILGRRSSATAIRAGADEMEVEALFELRSLSEEEFGRLPELVRDSEEGRPDELLLSRRYNRAGRNKVFINGRLGTVGLLEEIAGALINICGQNQQVRLLDPVYHRTLIDNFADHPKLLDQYQQAYRDYGEASERLARATERAELSQRREAELREIVADLEPLGVRAGTRADLESEVRRQAGAEQILARGDALSSRIESDAGALAELSTIVSELVELSRLDPRLEELAQIARDSRTVVAELSRDLQTYLRRLSVDEKQLEELRERLSEVARLERKYRKNDGELEALLRTAQVELGTGSVEDPEALRADLARARDRVFELGRTLMASRVKAGRELSRIVIRELSELAMVGARLELKISSRAEPGPYGLEDLELEIATNPGEPVKPLRLVASGGELSRIMLVLKKVLRDRSGVNVLVFDEVDTGVSGKVARAVGEKLRELARNSQVLCITHLPQVASLGERHLLVSKQLGKRASSSVQLLEGPARVEEIARMLAGYDVSEASRASARELLSS